MGKSKVTVAVTHIVSWILFSALIVSFVENFESTTHFSLLLISLKFLVFVLIYVVLFYLNYFLLFPKFYLQKKFALYFVITLILFAIVYFIRPFDNFAMHSNGGFRESGPHGFRPSMPPPHDMQQGSEPPRPPMRRGRHADIISLIFFIMIWSLSGALQLFKQWRSVLEKAALAEAEKATAELSFLRSQINPHFLFNTLNNIYSLAVQKSDSAPDAIMKLSKIMRYVTDEVSQDYVPLEDEIDCLKDYIDLQKLRLSKKVTVDFSVSGDTAKKKIAPLVLMPFVENMFKYGISNHEPSTVTIKLSGEKDKIHFYCRNRMFTRQEQMERTGVGINNTIKRLQHFYDGKYNFEVKNEENFFTVELIIFA